MDRRFLGFAAGSAWDGGLALDFGAPVPPKRWEAPALAPPWANAGGDATRAGFMRDADGSIRLRGRLTRAPGGKSGKRALPLAVFTFPEGCHPTYRQRFPVLSRGKLAVLEVEVGRNVVLVKGAIEDLSLDGVVIAEGAAGVSSVS